MKRQVPTRHSKKIEMFEKMPRLEVTSNVWPVFLGD